MLLQPTLLSNSISKYPGNSIVDYLHSIGEKASFTRRCELAKQYGIPNYKGTAEQNSLLLKLMGDNKPVAPTPVKDIIGVVGS